MDSISWRVQDNEIRFLFYLIQDFQYIPCNKLAVCNTIKGSVLFGSFYCFFHDFHSDYFFCYLCQDLGDGAGSAIQSKTVISLVSPIYSLAVL